MKGGTQLHQNKSFSWAKLTKLATIKFNGTHLDWFRFWKQFQTDTESNVAASNFRISKNWLFWVFAHLLKDFHLQQKITRQFKIFCRLNMELLHHMSNTGVSGKNLVKVCEIYEKFVQALEPMGKLQKTNSIVCLFVDKLPGIWATKNGIFKDWYKTWGSGQSETLWYQKTNKLASNLKKGILQTRQRQWMENNWIFCKEAYHKGTDCTKVTKINERKK